MAHGETSEVDTLLHRNKSSGLPALERAKSLLKSLTSPLLTFSPFLRAHKNVQMYLVSGDIATSTFSESHGRVRSWPPEAPSVFLRSTGLP